jgi:hypothetical protein
MRQAQAEPVISLCGQRLHERQTSPIFLSQGGGTSLTERWHNFSNDMSRSITKDNIFSGCRVSRGAVATQPFKQNSAKHLQGWVL